MVWERYNFGHGHAVRLSRVPAKDRHLANVEKECNDSKLDPYRAGNGNNRNLQNIVTAWSMLLLLPSERFAQDIRNKTLVCVVFM